jgi:two-component system chemotaxis response regulator CheB
VLDHDKRFQLLPAHANDIHLPSIDCLFESLAVVYGDSSVGVLLSGMGSDGAQGMVSIHRHGGLTIAQDEDSSVIFGMPKAAIDAGAVVEVLPLQAVSERLLKLQTLS